MENLLENMYKWQLAAVVNAVERYDQAISQESPEENEDITERLYGEMLCELAVARAILDRQSMISTWVGNA